jgi:protein TonB
MRLIIAYVVSAMVHLGVLGTLAFWLPSLENPRIEVVFAQGEPITASFSLAAMAEEQPVEVEVETEDPSEPEPAPPIEISAAEMLPVKQSLPPIDAVPTNKPLEELVDISLVGIEPTEVPPPTPSEPEPQLAAARAAKPLETPAEPVVDAAQPVRRQVRPPQEIAREQSVAMPFQQAAEMGMQVDNLPRKLPTNSAPLYPAEALAAGVQGRVVIRAAVSETGLVGEVKLETSSGSASLDSAALAAVRHWRFEPARRRGQAVAYDVLVPVRFSIR